jgi:hypothetical protein
MADDYDFYRFEDRALEERFDLPWIVGQNEWRTGIASRAFANPATGRDWLDQLRSAAQRRPTPRTPRVFVSHRQTDERWGRRNAWLSWSADTDFWLDVVDFDPAFTVQRARIQALLGRPPTRLELAILTAAIVEMALLNCTACIAVMTRNAAGSAWIPYEYGRMKASAVLAPHVACWHDHTTLPVGDLAEYLHLGAILRDEMAVGGWHAQVVNAGQPGVGGRSTQPWRGAIPPVLPTG